MARSSSSRCAIRASPVWTPTISTTKPAERERQLSPQDRSLVEEIMADHPPLTAALLIEQLTNAGGL